MALNLSFFFLDKMIAWRMPWEKEFPYCSPMQSHSKTHACRGNDGTDTETDFQILLGHGLRNGCKKKAFS